MKLIALITLVTGKGNVKPGDEIEIKDAAEAKSLVTRGFARMKENKVDAEAEAKAKAEAEASGNQS